MNHTLPTNGYARQFSAGVNTLSFQKHITSQEITPTGLGGLGPIVATLADCELMQFEFVYANQQFREKECMPPISVVPGIRGILRRLRAGVSFDIVENSKSMNDRWYSSYAFHKTSSVRTVKCTFCNLGDQRCIRESECFQVCGILDNMHGQ